MTPHYVLAEWSQWFWPSAINHLWQATLFALLVWAAMLALRQASPQMRYAAWLLALAKFLLPVAWLAFALDKLGLRFSRAESLAADFSTGALILVETAEPVAEIARPIAHHEVYCVLTLVWLLGMLAVLANWQLRRWRLAQSLRVESATPERVAELFAELQRQLGFKRQIPLIVSARIAEPGVWGIWRPIVVLPPGLDERLDDDELRAVLMHELFHIEQRDNLLSTVQMIICALFWFHPLVWLIDRKLMGECELMCDEKVIRFGGEAESYAAGLWKVVQHGLGWPVAGVSRVTGSNLKRRIELMLNAKYQVERSWARRLMTGVTFGGLFAIAIATAWLSRGSVQALVAKTPLQQGAAAVPVQFENAPEIPLVITEAALSFGEPHALTFPVGASEVDTLSMGRKGESVRDFDLTVKMLNQGDRRITQIAIEISQGQSVRLAYHAFALSSAPDAENRPQGIGAQEPSIFRLRLQLKETIEGEAVINHLHDFRLKMLGVKFEDESAMLWSEAAKKSYLQKGLIKLAPKPKPKSSQPADQDGPSESFIQDDPIQPMSASRRPKILYKEKAHYTKEARDQKVEGTVVLNLVFTADGKIENIRVVRGLPHGLTEAAIEAAKAIRFEPAMKDGQPFSVRGNIEYSFRLEESGERKEQ